MKIQLKAEWRRASGELGTVFDFTRRVVQQGADSHDENFEIHRTARQDARFQRGGDSAAALPHPVEGRTMSAFDRIRHRLARDRRAGWFAGVCAGLARYFDTDPAFFRVGFVVGCLFSWQVGLAVYVVAWVLLPAREREQ